MRAILFDLEETLVPFHTAERWQWAWRPQGPVLPARHVQAALKRGLRSWDRRRWEGLSGARSAVGEAEYRTYLREMLWEIADHRLPDPETEAVVDRFLKAPVDRTPAPDVVPVLDRLRKAGTRVGVLGERPGPFASEELRRAGLREHVDLVCGDHADAPWPPAKEAFRAACRALEAAPREVTFVGHLYWSEVRAAHRAGLPAFLLDPHDWWSKVAERRMHRLSELEAAIVSGPGPVPTPETEPNLPSAPPDPSGPSAGD